jgi:hypothetical protein
VLRLGRTNPTTQGMASSGRSVVLSPASFVTPPVIHPTIFANSAPAWHLRAGFASASPSPVAKAHRSELIASGSRNPSASPFGSATAPSTAAAVPTAELLRRAVLLQAGASVPLPDALKAVAIAAARAVAVPLPERRPLTHALAFLAHDLTDRVAAALSDLQPQILSRHELASTASRGPTTSSDRPLVPQSAISALHVACDLTCRLKQLYEQLQLLEAVSTGDMSRDFAHAASPERSTAPHLAAMLVAVAWCSSHECQLSAVMGSLGVVRETLRGAQWEAAAERLPDILCQADSTRAATLLDSAATALSLVNDPRNQRGQTLGGSQEGAGTPTAWSPRTVAWSQSPTNSLRFSPR